ncbi:MAG: glycoside hydrolase family 3 C-terminal domain-containing protein [Bacteroidetes bacterium]|nr:glycoside hydrolase family 3 C-terminal domain-containing protein [Bacteroidota bacterium]
MKSFLLLIATVLFILKSFGQSSEKYMDTKLPINERLEDLMSKMTLEEKIGQMCQYVAIEHIRDTKKKMKGEVLIEDDQAGMYKGMSIAELKQLVVDGKIGSFLHVKDATEANELQELVRKSRLKIPLLIGIDAIHGHAMIKGTTVYPTQLGLSSTWDNDLIKRVAKATAKEVRATGMHWTFSPNVDVARDARWGRCGETFGEDPFMVSQMGVAFTEGYQGNFGDNNILACAKHFIAGSESVNGTNASTMDVSMRQLREIWLPPYQAQVNAGVYTFMAAHNELNGIPCHGNKMLLTDILRNEWGFNGFVVSDWMDIERLFQTQKVVSGQKEAIELTVNAGMDMHMHGPDFLEPLAEMVKNGEISEDKIDESCRKILRSKFVLGLFENPFSDPGIVEKTLFNNQHKNLALEAAQKSIVLLKNSTVKGEDKKILPLKNKKRILVTGPNAHNHRILGDWVLEQPEENITTVYEGINAEFNTSQVDFINSGESLINPSADLLNDAVNKASDYDAVVVVVGSNSLRYDSKEKNCGENIDRANINLMGNQLDLVQKIYDKNKNVIVVFVNGRPLSEPWIKENVPAIIEAWEPGALGGAAIAEILSGKTNPSGKMTMSVPYSVGQITYTYNHKPMHLFHKFIDEPSDPLWEFGYGLSYADFKFSDLKIADTQIQKNKDVLVSVNVSNTSNIAGDEIVQLYIRDNYSSVTRPVKELKGYKRISLKAGETQSVLFEIPFNHLGFYNREMKFVVEPGEFTILVGNSSNDKNLKTETIIVLN